MLSERQYLDHSVVWSILYYFSSFALFGSGRSRRTHGCKWSTSEAVTRNTRQTNPTPENSLSGSRNDGAVLLPEVLGVQLWGNDPVFCCLPNNKIASKALSSSRECVGLGSGQQTAPWEIEPCENPFVGDSTIPRLQPRLQQTLWVLSLRPGFVVCLPTTKYRGTRPRVAVLGGPARRGYLNFIDK